MQMLLSLTLLQVQGHQPIQVLLSSKQGQHHM
jgi:hypothetical protein